ncbi:hypothetical protein VHUM_03182 [Vanrija humicola]|uniref:beta-glucosidase n=1 Tax=Vanrija humicola TaxID=5417 RepID=A0A7D8YUV9_VANHU|nr:hypothetical protein VHUM_03182 [Vanrija humicola]
MAATDRSPRGHGNAPDRSFLTASVPQLVKQLTLDEKILLLAGKNIWETAEVPRLGIPSVKVTDGPNGARGAQFGKQTSATALPNATCLAATFSSPLAEAAGHLLAAESKARGAVCLLAPTVNIQRTPLGGRAFESFSEDPTLSGLMAASYITGLQAGGVSATIKHFIGNDQEHERNGSNSIIAPRPLREIYLRPFQIAQRLARPGAYMTSYNRVNGIHASEDPWLLRELLRNEWGFDGLIMSDWCGTYSVSESINAGLDLEMPGPGLWRAPALVRHLVGANKIDERTIDRRVAEVLGWVQKYAKLNPEVVYAAKGPEKVRDSAEDRANDAALVRDIGAQGAVLLKNDGILPISSGKVAVIGPNAKSAVTTGGGSAKLRSLWAVTPWDGLEGNKPDAVELSYAFGCHGAKFVRLLDEQFTAEDGEHGFDLKFYVRGRDGELATEPGLVDRWDVSDLLLGEFQEALGRPAQWVAELSATFTPHQSGEYEFGTTITGSGKVYVDDTVVVDASKDQEPGTSFFYAGIAEKRGTFKVERGRTYTVRLVHDSRRPVDAGKQTQPLQIHGIRLGAQPLISDDDAIAEAVAAARAADKVVIVAGLNSDWESESYDRPDLSLRYRTDEMISAVAAANPNTVVVLQAGSAVGMPWLDSVAGVVLAWYGGNETGNAIADVVYGRANPSGRLPLSFPRREVDIAAALNAKSARTDIHYEEGIWVGYKHFNARRIAPLFPFGHGLSYTTWAYADLEVAPPRGEPSPDEWRLEARVTVTNTGKVAGAHSVHFYTAPPAETATSLLHPEHALQAFVKLHDVQPGESRVAAVVLDKYAVSHWDERWKTWRVEQGTWAVRVGVDAQTMYGRAEFEVGHDMEWTGL